MIELNGISVPFLPIGGINPVQKKPFDLTQGLSEFQKVFATELSKLNLSTNAQSSIKTNGIELSDFDMIKLESAFTRAETTNSKESMIMLNDNAYIVDVPNKTITNVVQKDQLRSTVITNIDSAIFT